MNRPLHFLPTLFNYHYQKLGLWALLIGLLLFAVSANAQRLGGIPDESFNAADSGLSVPNLNRKNQIFYPGPKGGIYVGGYGSPYFYGHRTRHAYYYAGYYSHELRAGRVTDSTTHRYLSGRLLQSSPGKFYCAESGYGYYSQSPDSIRINRPIITKVGNTDPVRLSRQLYFYKPYRGFPETGIARTAPNRLVFWLTSHATDTAAPHNTTTLFALDSIGNPTGITSSIANFRAERSSSLNGKIYLIGRAIAFDSVQYGTQIRVVDGNTLSPLNLIALGDLAIGPIQIFSMLPTGKALVAGMLNNGTLEMEQAMRLMPDGSRDATYIQSFISGSTGTKWQLDEQGILRAGIVNSDADGLNGSAVVFKVGTEGNRLATASTVLDATFPWCRPMMYNPSQDAFLFETGDIYPTTTFPGYSYPYLIDTSYGLRHRFYVSYARQTWPLVNRAGVGLSQEYLNFTINPVQNKIVVTGMMTQTNKKVLPGLAVLNADGTLDPVFKGLLHLPKSEQSKFLVGWGVTANMTNTGRILIKTPMYSQDSYGTYSDSTFRLLPNGDMDPAYTKVLSQGVLLAKRDGRFAAVRNFDMTGNPTSTLVAVESDTRLVELDGEGNALREYGSYKPTGYPDTLGQVWYRSRTIFTQDDAKGVWVSMVWSQPSFNTGGAWYGRNYFVRYDSTGRTRVINPTAFTFVGAPIKIEMLAGKRMRMTGVFNLKDTTLAGRYANIIETDSAGNLDVSVLPKAWAIPDVFGRRVVQYITPVLYLPDGKLLAYLSAYNSSHAIYLRFYADGRYDPSFMPISALSIIENSTGILGDRFYLGGLNFNTIGYSTNRVYYTYGNAKKNGVAAFTISSRPGNTGYVLGRVEQVTSPATGCSPAGPRLPARGMLLKAQPGNRLAFTDTAGSYTMILDTGRYALRQQIENNFLQRQVCPAANAPRIGHLASNGAADVAQNFINQTFDCPRLDLQALSPRFRLCSKSVIRLQYQNDGVAEEPAARIRLNLPAEVRILSANRAYRQETDSSYVFDLGRLGPGSHGELILRDTIACLATPDSLARACYSARIEPLSLCSRIDPATLNWDGAWLDAEARYLPASDMVRVVIRNRGAAMLDSVPVSLLSNGYSYLRGKQKLAARDSIVQMVPPAIQGSIYLALTQPTNCPLGSQSSLFHSGRGTARAFLHFGSGLLETYTIQACPSFRYSFDPNEKAVEPQGEVEPGAELHYTIYFENYGNDTAYVVSVEDSLPVGLDVNTMKLGASSHPYQVVVEGNEAQPVLYFNFNPIKLTGKKEDSVRSKGQVEFTIRTKPSIARGSIVQNHASIFFDRNDAVVTEPTKTPIANLAVTSVHQSLGGKSSLSIYPNPAQGTCRIVAKRGIGNPDSESRKPVSVRLISPEGRLVIQQPLQADGTLRLTGLAAGVYTVLVEGYRPERLIIIR